MARGEHHGAERFAATAHGAQHAPHACSRADAEERGIEAKCHAGAGQVEITEAERARACQLHDGYLLSVAHDCATAGVSSKP